MKSYTKTIDIPPSPQNLCFSTDQQRPPPAPFQTPPPRGGKNSYCPPEQTSEVANTMCEVVGGGERGPMGARAVLTRLKLVFLAAFLWLPKHSAVRQQTVEIFCRAC